jgi:hypothetical protein
MCAAQQRVPIVPNLDDVYRKFGEASEAAQLLETELGTMLFAAGAIEADLFSSPGSARAAEILDFVNRQTLGQLLRSLNRSTDELTYLEPLLIGALKERNRLAHSFYRQHNFRRNSESGCQIMLDDLETIHKVVLDAYRGVLLLTGIDIYASHSIQPPQKHLPIS